MCHDKAGFMQVMLVSPNSQMPWVDLELIVTQPSKKTQMQKTAHDFQLSFVMFQCAQQVSAEKQHIIVVESIIKLAVEVDLNISEPAK